MSVNIHKSTQPIMSEDVNIQMVMAKVNDIFFPGFGTVVTKSVDCLKNNQHDVTCGLSFIFMGSRHSFSTCFELSGSSSSGDHFSCTVSLWYSV